MDRVALDFGFIQIYWYSIFMFLGMLAACFVIFKEAKHRDINEDFLVNLAFNTIIFGIIGARLYYVLFNLPYYLAHPVEIFEIWNGGLAIHGGILVGLITLIIYCKRHNQDIMKILDIVVVGIIIGQAIGRWGNFFNSEAFGIPTNLPWKLYIAPQYRPIPFTENEYFHPTFLYESILDLIIFAVLFQLTKQGAKKDGNIALYYLLMYSIGRIFVEHLRIDSVCYILGYPVAMVISAGIIVLVSIILILNNRTKKDF